MTEAGKSAEYEYVVDTSGLDGGVAMVQNDY